MPGPTIEPVASHRANATAVSDGALLEAVIAGDPGASWELWQRHSQGLYTLCYAEMKRNRADAEDALAQSMLKAIVQLPRFAPHIVSVPAWLRRLTRNVCRDMQREQARLRRAEEAFPAWKPEAASDVPLQEGEPCEPVALLERLPERLREVFALRILQQMRYSDIAARLQLTPAAARKRVQQARRLVNAWRHDGIAAHCERVCSERSAPVEPPLIPHKVRVRSASGIERDVEILVRRRPAREHQKIATLRGYIRRHPQGWKKRLALADLLYETGAWSEAMDSYRAVLHKRPWLTAVAQRVEEMARELEKFT